MDFKKRLNDILNSKNMSANQLSKLTGLSTGTLSEISNPRLDSVLKICKALNITVSELLGFEPTQDYLDRKTDNPNTIVKEISEGVKVAINKNHKDNYTDEELKLALELIRLARKNQSSS